MAIQESKNICFLVNNLPAGGAERQLFVIAQVLLQHGFTCQIRTLARPAIGPSLKGIAAKLTAVGLEIRRWSFRELPTLRSMPRHYWTWGRRADLTLKLFKPLLPGKLYCSIRDTDEHKMRRFRHLENLFNSRVDKYISNSWLAADQLSAYVPDLMPRLTVLLNCIPVFPPPIEHAPAQHEFRVAMLANILVHKKGYDIALDLASKIKSSRLPIKINVAGRDESRGQFAAAIQQRGLGDTIIYQGATARPFDFLRSHDCFLMLSRYEGLPNALVEAMSLGLPSVTTPVGDVPELFRPGQHLEIISHTDSSEALAALERIRNSPDYAARLGRAAREACLQLFSREKLEIDLLSLFALKGLAPAESRQNQPSS
jgi:glycosyltransferase involved in cell wall biosynthesis